MTIEQQIADLTTATTGLTNEVLATKATADANATAAGLSAATATTKAAEALASKDAAVAAKDLAEAAKIASQTAESNAVAVVTGGTASLPAAAGMIPIADAKGVIDDGWLSYTIPALAAQYPGLNVVASCFYDTSKDSDGGAWIHRTADLGYGKEAVPSGRYVGSHTDATGAISEGGAGIGDWYHQKGSGSTFREITGLNPFTSVVIDRAGSDKFPAQALFILEDRHLTIFDASGSELTMWMKFVTGGSTNSFNYIVLGGLTSLAVSEGRAYLGRVSAMVGLDFAGDRVAYLHSSESYDWAGAGMDKRNSVPDRGVNKFTWMASDYIINTSVNSIATNTASNAPTDPVTGLKVPTVAVATNGGVSVIKSDGAVVDSADSGVISSVCFDAERNLYFTRSGAKMSFAASYTIDGFGAEILNVTTIPISYVPVNTDAKEIVVGPVVARNGVEGVELFHHNQALPTESMIAHITDKSNTGWMIGDTQLAALCETEVGAIVETDLVTDGSFTVDVGSFVGGNGATIAAVGGELEITTDGTASAYGREILTTTPGVVYNVSGVARTETGQISLVAQDNSNYSLLGSKSTTSISNTSLSFSFTAVSTQTRLSLQYDGTPTAGDKFFGDDLKVRPAVLDHSGNGNHLEVIGTLNRAPIGNGEIAAWSGFTASTNQLVWNSSADKFPYDSDWVFAFWTDASEDFVISQRGADAAWNTSGRAGFQIHASGSGGSKTIAMRRYSSDNVNVAAASKWPEDSRLKFVVGVKEGETFKIYLDGEMTGESLYGWGMDRGVAYDDLRVVMSSNTTRKFTLMRYSTTIPTADQIAKMYRDELAMLQGKAVLDGNDSDVKAMAYDKERDLLHVASTGVVSSFRGLERVKSSLDGAVNMADPLSSFVGYLGTTISGNEILLNTAPGQGDVICAARYFSNLNPAKNYVALYRVTLTSGDLRINHNGSGETEETLSNKSGWRTGFFSGNSMGDKLVQFRCSNSGATGTVHELYMYEVSKSAPITSLDSQDGSLIVAGSSGIDVTIPAVSIRERLAQALPKPATQTEDFFFTGDAVKSDFPLPRGWKPKRVWIDGGKTRKGSAEDWTIKFDGFVYSISFNTAPALNSEIDVEAVSV